ncbi:hypothetical protein CPB85DRAFT_1255917 [Mucidula mucida]|nr:hypothetical protein CPB85DRAFT_1255917 [Mucidula mucida]
MTIHSSAQADSRTFTTDELVGLVNPTPLHARGLNRRPASLPLKARVFHPVDRSSNGLYCIPDVKKCELVIRWNAALSLKEHAAVARQIVERFVSGIAEWVFSLFIAILLCSGGERVEANLRTDLHHAGWIGVALRFHAPMPWVLSGAVFPSPRCEWTGGPLLHPQSSSKGLKVAGLAPCEVGPESKASRGQIVEWSSPIKCAVGDSDFLSPPHCMDWWARYYTLIARPGSYPRLDAEVSQTDRRTYLVVDL